MSCSTDPKRQDLTKKEEDEACEWYKRFARSRLKQSKQRKDASIKYCKRHGIHYIDECPYCFCQRTLEECGY